MRITKVNITKDFIENGLEDVRMDRLGRVVVLTGKNGSGKSRLLELIQRIIKGKPDGENLYFLCQNRDMLKQDIKSLEKDIKEARKKMKLLPQGDSSYNEIVNVIDSKKQAILKAEIEYAHLQKYVNWNFIETDTSIDKCVIIPFVPKDLNLKDTIELTYKELKESAKNVDQLGTKSLGKGTFARIQVIQDSWITATHQNTKYTDDEKAKAIEDYVKLKELINIFLNEELDRNNDGEPTLFGFPLGKAKFSDGQKVLLQLCLAIHCQNKSLDEIILFLDEPENHLHPSVIIEIIERIIFNAKHGQIWIATHSIPLIAYFDPSYLWFVDNNKVSYAGNIPEKVLSSLLGDEDQIMKLQDFISLPGILALNRHTFESLFYPVVLNTEGKDPQSLQIKEEIKIHLSDKNKIRILDYGAGKGRLLANINENSNQPNEKMITWLDYIAFDKYNTDRNECKAILNSIYPDGDKRYFNDFSDLYCNYDRESFDVVVMCNVLHEIDPKQWLKLFSETGEIPSLLNENGILLLVEDHEMLIGEKAYQKGFIVLNTQEIKLLFNIKETDKEFGFNDARGDGRLKAHRIGKQYLMRITSESRSEALKLLHNTAKEKILAIRNDKITYKNGKKLGFWVQQYANTGLALDELTNK